MRDADFDEIAFFRAIAESGASALLIGRRALVILGLPVLTADYDFWVHIDHLARFNAAAATFELHPAFEPDEARRRGRYVLENGEHIDVLVARSVTTIDGITVRFDDVWARRRTVRLGYGAAVDVHMPGIEDLILTKRFAARPRDLEDIRLLRMLQREDGDG